MHGGVREAHCEHAQPCCDGNAVVTITNPAHLVNVTMQSIELTLIAGMVAGLIHATTRFNDAYCTWIARLARSGLCFGRDADCGGSAERFCACCPASVGKCGLSLPIRSVPSRSLRVQGARRL